MTNLQRTTLASFMAYFVMSGMLAPIGIVSAPMAEFFGTSVTSMTREFSWLTGGILVGATSALFLYHHLQIRQVLMAVYLVMTGCLASLGFLDTLDFTRLALAAIGIGCGLGMAGAAITIARSYDDDRRASMLVITDGCFSLAGIVIAWIASILIVRQFAWSAAYQGLALLTLAILVFILISRFPEQDESAAEQQEPWPFPVWLCFIALFLYTLAQNSMLFWLPTYAREAFNASPEVAGSLIRQFWIGMLFAQLFAAWWVLRIGVRRLVLISPTTALLFSIPVWLVTSIDWLVWLTLLWGFFNLAILKAILSYATLMVTSPGSRLVSLLMLGSTLGTAVTPAITSQLVEWFDPRAALVFSSASYSAILVVILTARVLDKSRRTRSQVS